jgi:hypothetical protein
LDIPVDNYLSKTSTKISPEQKLDYSVYFDKIRYGLLDVLLEYTSIGWLFCCKSIRKKRKIIEKANEKFENEMDIINLLHKIRRSDALWSNILSK